ncbi:PIN domain-containing protein [[Mycobacterium] manitobense]|uniref:PIN domain-containing protein n=1 Tax=[Mycobacterium] manitobense TaxID=190147 RepID=UPI0021F2A12C|nr:PIN domain-containing protein [[Mycobacterium] manitobense]
MVLRTGTIALDTNILLDLYRIGSDQREQILDLFAREEVRSRIWIPYYVGLEFQRRRLDVARQHKSQYRKVRDDVEALRKSLNASLEGIRDKEVRSALATVVDSRLGAATDSILLELGNLEHLHVIDYEDIRSQDPIRVRLDRILNNPAQIGPRPSDEVIAARKDDALQRYEAQIPPGYLDIKKNDNVEGDALIWFEILDHAASTDRPVIFVTSDVKEDWYRREAGETIGPRPELRVEFASRSIRRYHQVNLGSFLRHANAHLNARVTPTTLDSVDALDDARNRDKAELREKRRLKRFFSSENARAMSRALSFFDPNSSQYRDLIQGLESSHGEGVPDPAVVRRALAAVDHVALELGRKHVEGSSGRGELNDEMRSSWLSRQDATDGESVDAKRLRQFEFARELLGQTVEVVTRSGRVVGEVERISEGGHSGPVKVTLVTKDGSTLSVPLQRLVRLVNDRDE